MVNSLDNFLSIVSINIQKLNNDVDIDINQVLVIAFYPSSSIKDVNI